MVLTPLNGEAEVVIRWQWDDGEGQRAGRAVRLCCGLLRVQVTEAQDVAHLSSDAQPVRPSTANGVDIAGAKANGSGQHLAAVEDGLRRQLQTERKQFSISLAPLPLAAAVEEAGQQTAPNVHRLRQPDRGQKERLL